MCPYVESALRHVAEYKHDEVDWLVSKELKNQNYLFRKCPSTFCLRFAFLFHPVKLDFRDVLSRVMTKGFSTHDCDDTICKLSS
jgi:hypothetical protein